MKSVFWGVTVSAESACFLLAACLASSLILKMEAVGLSETSIVSYATQPRILEFSLVFILVALRISEATNGKLRRTADKSLAFPISYFPVCSTTKRIFLGWVKEVRTTKS
jgi:hypothetical protein